MRPLLPLLLLVGCSEYGLSGPDDRKGRADPAIEVAPMQVDFGSARIGGESLSRTVSIRSIGGAPLTIEALTLDGEAFSLVDAAPRVLDPGAAAEVRLDFTPDGPGLREGLLTIRSDAREDPLLEVPLSGRGREPWLFVDPLEHDFGAAPIPCADQVELTLQNVGDADLTLSELTWTADAQLSLDLEVEAPRVLAPGAFVTATVRLDPLREGAIAGALAVGSDDPRGRIEARQTASPQGAGTGSDRWTTASDPPVDIVLAVDRSASMEDDAERLADSFDTFIAGLGAVTDSWRLGVVTLDSGCFNEGTLTADRPDLLAAFRTAVTTGEDREIVDDEALFSLVDRALVQTEGTGCNAGFRRDGAALHVIVVSDEPERSAERVSSLTWDTFVDRWRDRVRTPALLKVSGVVDLDACADGADGYEQAIAETDGEALSLCAGTWGERATTLARAVVDRLIRLPLSGTPVPATLEVVVGGEPTEDWTYDAAANELVMGRIPAGSKVQATYTLAQECP